MAETEAFERTPLALIVEGNGAYADRLSALLSGNGFAVVHTETAAKATDLLGRVRPDLLLVGVVLPDATGPDTVRTLAAGKTLRSSTPVIVVSSRKLDAASRVESFEAGAWEVLDGPIEDQELMPQLRSFVAAKLDADAAREEGLLDPATGFYNLRGLLRRTGEVTADAARYRRPVTCIVVGPDPGSGVGEEDRRLLDQQSMELAVGITATTRLSDTLGRLGDSDFVVVAAGTDPEGANTLAERLLDRLERSVRSDRPLRFKAGVYSVPGAAEVDRPLIPVDLLTRATLALRKAQDAGVDERILGYQRVSH